MISYAHHVHVHFISPWLFDPCTRTFLHSQVTSWSLERANMSGIMSPTLDRFLIFLDAHLADEFRPFLWKNRFLFLILPFGRPKADEFVHFLTVYQRTIPLRPPSQMDDFWRLYVNIKMIKYIELTIIFHNFFSLYVFITLILYISIINFIENSL